MLLFQLQLFSPYARLRRVGQWKYTKHHISFNSLSDILQLKIFQLSDQILSITI